MGNNDLIYIGMRAHVVALDKATGAEVWRRQLNGSISGDRFVTLLVENERIYAHTKGELYCLDAMTGSILWRNELRGLSYDLASLALSGSSSSPANIKWKKNSDSSSDGSSANGGGGD